MSQGSLILDKLSKSQDLCKRLKRAAQTGDQAEVDRLVKSTGVKVKVITTYTPSGIKFELHEDTPGQSHGFLTLNINWE
jgi:hypothetical protein